ncbi:isochorismatase family protein [Guyparkeria sp. 1SP6A2]|nr:isochorismatase family protein [Guyparkeria sp. 1SP6A2]
MPERRNDPAARDVSLIWVGGLALDVCVQATAREARAHGFEVVLIEAATRPVSAADGEAAIRRLREDGVEVLPDE